MDQKISQIGCFKIGSKVCVGSSLKVREITGFHVGSGLNKGTTYATIKGGVIRDIRTLSLAGPNGDGVGL